MRSAPEAATSLPSTSSLPTSHQDDNPRSSDLLAITLPDDHLAPPRLGIYRPDDVLREAEKARQRQWLVRGLLQMGSVNILAGDSGLGKTPLAITLGLCVAAGVPLLGREVQQGRVLYCDGESGVVAFGEWLTSIGRHLRLGSLPEDFCVWSPDWRGGSESGESLAALVRERIRDVRPALVILDSQRVFFPDAESKPEKAVEMRRSLLDAGKESDSDCTFLAIHHLRKPDASRPPVDLAANPREWLWEVCGRRALINQTDTRLGVAQTQRTVGGATADLVLNGFLRGFGDLQPIYLAREFDDNGDPIGYRQLGGIELLGAKEQDVFRKLERSFRFRDVATALGGTSDSNAVRVINCFINAQVARRIGEGRSARYEKLV